MMVCSSPLVLMTSYFTIPIPDVLVSVRPTVTTGMRSGLNDVKSLLSFVTERLAPESQTTSKTLLSPTAFLKRLGAVKAAFKAMGSLSKNGMEFPYLICRSALALKRACCMPLVGIIPADPYTSDVGSDLRRGFPYLVGLVR